MMRKFISPIGCALVLLSACQSEPHFTVEGTISEAAGEMLYLEASGIEEITTLDSVKLGDKGTYKFKSARPDSPEYYRLRIKDQIINFSIDSTETVTIDAPAAELATKYTVKGSESCEKIKELTLKQMNLQQRVDALLKNASSLPAGEVQDSLYSMVDSYKQEVKRQYIFKEPYKPYAYFALFQKLGSYLIFDPLNSREDIKCFQAVATSLNNDFPHSVRAKNLYNIVMRGLKNTRAPQRKVIEIPADKIKEADLIDIQLKDLNGNVRSLTELKGKVVLLDFTVYQNAASPTRNLALREAYEKYHDQGFEIYQISLDADEHFWKTSADNLPWICVRDADGIYSNYLGIYAVNSIPSFFLINRGNQLTARGETVKDLDEAIKKLL